MARVRELSETAISFQTDARWVLRTDSPLTYLYVRKEQRCGNVRSPSACQDMRFADIEAAKTGGQRASARSASLECLR